jgi:hypothetical protein
MAMLSLAFGSATAEDPGPSSSYGLPRVVIRKPAKSRSPGPVRPPLAKPAEVSERGRATKPAEVSERGQATGQAVPIPDVVPRKSQVTPVAATQKPAAVKDPKQLRRITTIRPFQDYSPTGRPPVARKPEELDLGGGELTKRVFESQVYHWKPTDLYHFPLYFEDAPLERYGHTHHELVQPFVSAHRFGMQLIGLPYQMTIDPILKKTYTLGWYRPGEPAPMLLYQVPWNTEAAAVQAGVTTGLFFLVP